MTLTPAARADVDRWPELADPPTSIRARRGAGIAAALLHHATAALPLRVVDARGTRLSGAGGPDAPTMVLHRPEATFARLADAALVGFGEGYMAGDWDSPDVAALLSVLANRMGVLVPAPLQRLRRWYDDRHPVTQRNVADHARGNIAHHYDLSNDLFALFLDETLTYSSALFADLHAPLPRTAAGTSVVLSRPKNRPVAADLADAQRRKVDRLLDAAAVGAGTSLLEIGSGWGELALRAAQRGAQVRTITLSVQQQEAARRRVAAAGLSERVSVDLVDYRAVDGSYDAVVSCEMIEAVGYEFLPSYFATIDARLRPGGRAAIQAITMPHERMMASRHTRTWITKWIFPGGFIPSTELVEQVVTEHTGLRIEERFRMGMHYEQTLRLWEERFEENWPVIRELHTTKAARTDVDEVFRRLWRFYLAYSRAGFASGYLDVQQVTLIKDR
jgi:cyclopropane-fatty-acyl-phospholipid synthase